MAQEGRRQGQVGRSDRRDRDRQGHLEVEAVDEGTIAKIVVPEGTADVPVNQVIAVLAGEGET